MLVLVGSSAGFSIATASSTDLRRQPVRRVAIVGGTHGNELLGIKLVGMLQQRPEEARRKSFETVCVLANPEAIAVSQRYVSVDLNRCFTSEALDGDPDACSVEETRARELDAMLGPKWSESPQCDLCLDVHTTTSAVGTCLMMAREDSLAVELAAHLQRRWPAIRIVFWAKSREETGTLPTLARSGMTVEVGALPQGVCTWRHFEETRRREPRPAHPRHAPPHWCTAAAPGVTRPPLWWACAGCWGGLSIGSRRGTWRWTAGG